MKKYDLLQSGDSIIRVLEIQDKILIIDCVKQTMQLARRSLGLRYDVMEYGSAFRTFCEVLFSYQYVRRRTEITDAIVAWLYEHSGGNLSVVVSLIHDAQEIVILDGTECLNLESLNEAYFERLSLLRGYINVKQKSQTSRTRKKEVVNLPDTSTVPEDISIMDLVSSARSDGTDIVQRLREYLPVVEVAI